MPGPLVKRRGTSQAAPVTPSTNAGTMRGSGGKGLLGYLANNFPDLYNTLVGAPREPSRIHDYKDEEFAAKHPSQSGRYP